MPEQEKYEVRIDEDIKELIPEFLAGRGRDVTLLREAVGKADYRSAGRIAHAIKGSGGSYGFVRISELAKEIGAAARNGDRELLAAMVERLADYLANVKVKYD